MSKNFNYKNFSNYGESWVKYEGSFRNDCKHGIGKIYFTNGDKFFGNFLEDKINGQGTFHKNNGEVIAGEWKDNLLINEL